MGLRTIQVLGLAYSESGDVSITASFNGELVHDGVVPTVASAPVVGGEVVALIEFDVDDTLIADGVPSSFEINGGTVMIAGLAANKMLPSNLAQFIEFWESEPGLKTNIKIDSVLIDAVEPSPGYHYEVNDGATIEVDFNFPVPLGNVPGHIRVAADSCVPGTRYVISRPGDTDFTAMGSANSLQGTEFTCTIAGSGTGSVFRAI